MKHILLTIAIMTLLAFAEKNKLMGRWETKPSPNGNITGVIFRTDSTFEGYVNKKPFVTGKYTFINDVFSFTDNGCNGYQGTYKVEFFSNEDSMRFVPIQDSCLERKEGMIKLIMGRVKSVIHEKQ